MKQKTETFLMIVAPVFSLIIETFGIWKTHLMAGMLLCGGVVATAFSNQYYHVIISYALVEGKSHLSLIACLYKACS